VLPGHPNGMRFTAFDSAGAILRQEVYYSVGGGFIEREGLPRAAASDAVKLPYPFSSATVLPECTRRGLHHRRSAGGRSGRAAASPRTSPQTLGGGGQRHRRTVIK
jgi:hypothetical protein